MLETDHQITCDQCDDEGLVNDPVHSWEEIGNRATVGEFRKVLRRKGWKLIKGRDICPDCVKRNKKRPAVQASRILSNLSPDEYYGS